MTSRPPGDDPEFVRAGLRIAPSGPGDTEVAGEAGSGDDAWPSPAPSGRGREPGRPLPRPLSPRERQVLAMILGGRGRRHARDVLGIAPSTFDTVRQQVMSKLGASSTAELVRVAMELGLIHRGSDR